LGQLCRPRYYRLWEQGASEHGSGTPPVFIVVCNNTNVSKLVYDYIAGWEKTVQTPDDEMTVLVSGKLPRFSNVADGRWTPRPNTILVDSEQLESGEAMSDDFKKIAAREIEEFKEEYRRRFPGRHRRLLESSGHRSKITMNEFVALTETLTTGPLLGYGEAIQAVSGVYTAWLLGESTCLYVGRADNLRDRIRDHFSGQRGSNQFCLYVYDRFVWQTRIASGGPMTTPQVNSLTQQWIRENVRFRTAGLANEQTRDAERHLRQSLKPTLNPL
jgi:GIY-YIG catalytic domain-containing protein